MAPGTFNYFDLPGELRESIQRYLLVKPEGFHIDTIHKLNLVRPMSPERCCIEPQPESNKANDDRQDDEQDREHEPLWPVNYFLVSRTFYREASAIFFEETEFHLHTIGYDMWRKIKRDPEPKQPPIFKYPESLRRVRRVVLTVQIVGGMLRVMIPGLREMVLAGGLKCLDVRLRPETQRCMPPWRWTVGLGGQLLELLRDPRLEVARLRMGLCRGQDVGGLASLCPCRGGPAGAAVTMTDGEGQVWCDIDVEELVGRYGGKKVDIFGVRGSLPK
ncbi:hypothetical protein VM1G_05885 [Cytospora mali]|uniref:F-box domain-containing protein n=1 Tax=Cytospora mali TaxID=578113 RepID=A0A194W1X3_CYTMA|nr:hypothetical protein VM1G_05885 [Valsa mali]